jgi:hypothetical protein
MLRFVLYLIFTWWALSLGRRLLRRFRHRQPPQARGTTRNRSELSDLTQQDISDADYEEIP